MWKIEITKLELITRNDKKKILCFELSNYETKNIKLKINSNDTYIIEATLIITGSIKNIDLGSTTKNNFKINGKSLSSKEKSAGIVSTAD